MEGVEGLRKIEKEVEKRNVYIYCMFWRFGRLTMSRTKQTVRKSTGGSVPTKVKTQKVRSVTPGSVTPPRAGETPRVETARSTTVVETGGQTASDEKRKRGGVRESV